MRIDLPNALCGNTYPGRGIIIGKTADGRHAAVAYFIMGRSENSRNRIFEENETNGIRTRAYDESKLVDPSLIIYSPVHVLGNRLIVTNGDQTDTIYDYIKDGKTFEEALRTRTFEPDPPNFTPRISGIATFAENDFSYKLSILKSNDGNAVPHCVSSMNMHSRSRARVILSTPINATAIRSRALTASRRRSKSATIWMRLPICCGLRSMRITKSACLRAL